MQTCWQAVGSKALLTGKVPEKELNRQRLSVAKALIRSKKYDHPRIIRFLYFLKQFVHIENPGINRHFDKQIDKLTGKQNTMGIIETIKKIEREDAFGKGIEKGIKKGIEKGIGKGIEEGKAQVVANLISAEKFTISEIANFASVSESFIKRIQKRQKK